jgi:hypothetical protein
MADHLQQQILDYVKNTLTAAATAAAGNVFLDRVDELMQVDLPAIHIEGGDEEANLDSLDFPTVSRRTYNFTVCCICGQASGAAKAARNLAGQVESALLASTTTFTAGGAAGSLGLFGSVESKDANASVALFEVRQNWQASYATFSGAPDTNIYS